MQRFSDLDTSTFPRTTPVTRAEDYEFEALAGAIGRWLRPGQLTVLAGRPSTGRTALALMVSEDYAARGQTVLLYSFEHRSTQLFESILLRHRLDLDVHAASEEERRRVHGAMSYALSLPMLIGGGLVDVASIRETIVKVPAGMAAVSLLVVDYIQLIRITDEDRTQGMSMAMLALSRMAPGRMPERFLPTSIETPCYDPPMSIIVELGPVRIEFRSRYAILPRPGIMDPAYSAQELVHGTIVYADGGLRIPRTDFQMTVAEIRRLHDCLSEARGPIGAFANADGLFTIECSGGPGEEEEELAWCYDADPITDFRLSVVLFPREQPYVSLVLKLYLEWHERRDVLSSLQAAIDAAEGVTEVAPDWERSFRLEG